MAQAPVALVADVSEALLWAPQVTSHEGHHYIFYTEGSAARDGNVHVHPATSPDMNEWTRDTANPLFVDGFEARDPMVLRVGSAWVMYYTATEPASGGKHVVAFRTSTKLLRRHRGIPQPRPLLLAA